MRGLLPTKFYFPPIPAGIVPRPQLLELLDDVTKRRLVLVSAPAGAGKTTLVSTWVHFQRNKGTAIGWLSLDEADNDPARFLEYLAACLEEGGTVIDVPSLPTASTQSIRLEDTLSEFIRGLMDLKRDVILILDDYHLIQNKQIHAALQYFLDRASPRLHLILMTRSDPPLELARLRLAGQLGELRMDQLRFSVPEAAEFLKGSTGLNLAEADVSLLNARAEGWVAGLQMAAISLMGAEEPSTFIAAFAGSHRYVFDYLIEQVLNRQSPEVRDFLLKTSILQRFSPALCEAVTGITGARGLLASLECSNLFLVPLDDEHHWFRYHHLFSDLLRLVLEQTYPGLTQELHHRACHWCEEQGYLAEALHHGLAASDMELVAQIVMNNVLALVENSEILPVLAQIDSIPLDQRISLPWLQVAYAWGLAYIGRNEPASRALTYASKHVEELPKDKRTKMLGHITAVQAYIACTDCNHPQAVVFSEQAEALLPEEEIAIRALNLTTLGNSMIQIHDDPRSVAVAEKALTLARQVPRSPHLAMLAAVSLAYCQAILGRFHIAKKVCEDALEIAEAYQNQNAHPLTSSASVYAIYARICVEAGEFEKALQYARKGVVLADLWGCVDTKMVCYAALALIFALLGQTKNLHDIWQQAQLIAKKGPAWHRKTIESGSLEYYFDTDPQDRAEIQQKLDGGQVDLLDDGSFLRARACVKLGRAGEALTLLEKKIGDCGNDLSMMYVRLNAQKALAHFILLDYRSAGIALEKALKVAAHDDQIITFVREGAAMEKLLRLAQTKSAEPEFIRRILAVFAARHKYKSEALPLNETLIEPLSERELEVLQHLNSYLSIPEIATLLVVSANTVRTHIKNIYAKLEVHGRSGAIKRASELGLLASA